MRFYAGADHVPEAHASRGQGESVVIDSDYGESFLRSSSAVKNNAVVGASVDDSGLIREQIRKIGEASVAASLCVHQESQSKIHFTLKVLVAVVELYKQELHGGIARAESVSLSKEGGGWGEIMQHLLLLFDGELRAGDSGGVRGYVLDDLQIGEDGWAS